MSKIKTIVDWLIAVYIFRQAQLDQERRDRELALRLAQEDQNQVEDIVLPPPLPRYSGLNTLCAWVLHFNYSNEIYSLIIFQRGWKKEKGLFEKEY